MDFQNCESSKKVEQPQTKLKERVAKRRSEASEETSGRTLRFAGNKTCGGGIQLMRMSICTGTQRTGRRSSERVATGKLQAQDYASQIII